MPSRRAAPPFTGVLRLDGSLDRSNQEQPASGELGPHGALGRPFWEATWWSWSPVVQQRLREAVALAAGGEVIRRHEVARIEGNRLVTVDFALIPRINGGAVTTLICSVIAIAAVAPDAGAGEPDEPGPASLEHP